MNSSPHGRAKARILKEECIRRGARTRQSSYPPLASTSDFDPPFPPAGGFRTYLFRVVPESWLSGGVRMMGAGMHQTHTVDIAYVIEGEV